MIQETDALPKRAWVYLATTAIALSLFAIAIVVGNVVAGTPPQADENTWAHLFQLAMAAQLPLLLLFLATADWKQRNLVLFLLCAQLIAAGAAFGALASSGY
jgi:cytochrome bd-type quinol oxidase subunit 2